MNRKYCLSYNAEPSGRWSIDTMKTAVCQTLKDGGAVNIENPVTSTILFEDPKSNEVSFWQDLLNEDLENEIFYYLCIVSHPESGIEEVNNPDPSLAKTFAEILKKLT